MNAGDLFLWVVLPYVAVTVFVVGHIWRWRSDQFGWTSNSNELLEQRLLAWGGPLFHYGALAAIAGHVLGILVPAGWTAAIGISENAYHHLAAILGTIAGLAVVVGIALLSYRRIRFGRIRRTTTHMDVAVLVLLAVVIGIGIGETIGVNLFGSGYDYRPTVAVWFRGLFSFHPRTELMATAPLVYQVHVVTAWLLFAVWPFSRLVHAWSYPIRYFGRPYVLYRSRVGSAAGTGMPPSRTPAPSGTLQSSRDLPDSPMESDPAGGQIVR